MTPEEVDSLQAGRELDRLIAIHVFGGRELDSDNSDTLLPLDLNYCHYSTDISEAWKVVEKLNANKVYFEMRNTPSGKWWFNMPLPEDENGSHTYRQTYADTMPLAICKAVLRMMAEKGNKDGRTS